MLTIERSADRDEVVFDATHLRFCCPMDLVAVTAWAAGLVVSGSEVVFIVPDNLDCAHYLQRMDVLENLVRVGVNVKGSVPSARRHDRSDTLIEVAAVTGSDDVNAFASRTWALVNDRLGGHAATANHSMISELLDNAVSHGESPVGAFAAAQVYPLRRRIEVGVADAGIGIREHLTQNRANRRYRTDASAIARAIEPGATGNTSLAGRGRGLGFSNLLTIAGRHGGTLTLRTGDGLGIIAARPNRATEARTGTTVTAVPGTWALLAVGFKHPPSTL